MQKNGICSIWNMQCTKYGTGTYRKWNVQNMECVEYMECAEHGVCKECAEYGLCRTCSVCKI